MTRTTPDKDTNQTHYYSQFWLDVASGRKIIGEGLSSEEEAEDSYLDEAPAPKAAARKRPAKAENELPEEFAALRNLGQLTAEDDASLINFDLNELEESAIDTAETDLTTPEEAGEWVAGEEAEEEDEWGSGKKKKGTAGKKAAKGKKEKKPARYEEFEY